MGTEKVQGKHNDAQVDTDVVCHEKLLALKKYKESTMMHKYDKIDTEDVCHERVVALKKYKESTMMNKLTQMVSAMKKYWHRKSTG